MKSMPGALILALMLVSAGRYAAQAPDEITFRIIVVSLSRALSPDSALFRSAEPLEIIEAHIAFGNLFAYDGKMRDTIDQFEKALAVAAARYPEAGPQILEMLGIAHLHQAEIDNGIMHKPGTRCLLTGRPSEPVAATADSEKAVDYFRRYLEAKPDDLEVKWLLNVTHMITGGYPARVPARFLIPASAFESAEDVGRFGDVAPNLGLDTVASAGGLIVDDFDNDGFVDLYVSNLGGGNFLYRNNGNRRFSELSYGAGVATQDRGFATWFFDYDNDGFDDLFVTSYYQSVEESAKTYLRLPYNANGMKLYRNTRDGRFLDVTRDVGLDRVYMPMGVNFGDIDNDGFLDIYMGTGSPSYGALVPSALLRNRDGKSFVDVTTSSGTGELHKGHGVAFVDLDNDGDQEILFEVGGATPGDAHAFRLFENPGHGNDWLGLRLVGVKTNRAAIGARITVTVEDERGAKRSMHRTVNSGGSFGASPLQQHVGLGRGAKAVEVEIYWPVSRTRQRFIGVAKNQAIEIRELADRFETLNRPPMPLRR